MDQYLQVFVKTVEMGNFSRAAEELHMTQPAVSQYIQSLERQVGTKLLERSSKYVRLNKAGEIVYHHAKEILSLYTRMQDVVDDLSDTASGELSIGASYTYGEYVLPHIIASMRRQYPRIKPKIAIGNTKDIAELVSLRRLDIGIVEGTYGHREKLHSEAFAEDEMYIFASSEHHFARQEEVSLEQLSKETWIVREEGSGTRQAVERMFAAFQFKPAPDQLLEFGSTQIIKESVEAGLGVTLLSRWATSKELTLGSLCAVKVSGTPIIRQFSLVTQATPYRTKSLEVFWELVRNSGL
jgi:LysR family transcriptional regulator, transcriptional activator of the cysJI operon